MCVCVCVPRTQGDETARLENERQPENLGKSAEESAAKKAALDKWGAEEKPPKGVPHRCMGIRMVVGSLCGGTHMVAAWLLDAQVPRRTHARRGCGPSTFGAPRKSARLWTSRAPSPTEPPSLCALLHGAHTVSGWLCGGRYSVPALEDAWTALEAAQAALDEALGRREADLAFNERVKETDALKAAVDEDAKKWKAAVDAQAADLAAKLANKELGNTPDETQKLLDDYRSEVCARWLQPSILRNRTRRLQPSISRHSTRRLQPSILRHRTRRLQPSAIRPIAAMSSSCLTMKTTATLPSHHTFTPHRR